MDYASLSFSLLFMLCLPGTVFSSIGNWTHCPENITVDGGCGDAASVTVYALFNTTNASQQCNSGYVYHVHIRRSGSGDEFVDKFGPEDPVSPIIVVEGTNGTICNISVTGSVEGYLGLYDLRFLAIFGPNLIPQDCEDHLFVKVPSPITEDISITCEGVVLKGKKPEIVNELGVLKYIITVYKETDIVYNTSINDITGSLFIPYTVHMKPGEWYDINVTASYCGGVWNSTIASFYTAIAPMIKSNENVSFLIVHRYSENATTNCSLLFKFEIKNNDCEVSYPKSATIITNCTSSVTRHKWNGTMTSHQPVSIRHDGSIIVDSTVPVNHQCDVRIIFNNGDLSTPIDTSVNTNELDSCSFIVDGSTLAFLCVFSQFSSRLKGCRVQLKLLTSERDPDTVCPHTMSNSTIDMTSNQTYGVINDLCNGLYSARCLGLAMIDPSSSRGSGHLLVYDPEYDTNVTVTADEVASCTTSKTTPATSISPSSVPIATKKCTVSCSVFIPVTVILVVLVLTAFIVLVAVLIWYFICRRN